MCIQTKECIGANIVFVLTKKCICCSGPVGQQWYLVFIFFLLTFLCFIFYFLDAMQWTDWAAVGLTSLVLAFAIADDVQHGTLSLWLSLSLSLTHSHAHFLSLSLPLYNYI